MIDRQQLRKILIGKTRVVLIHKPMAHKDVKAFYETLTDAFAVNEIELYDLDPAAINKSFLMSLWRIETAEKGENRASEMPEASRFRRICAALSHLHHGLVYIYNAHSMSGASVQLLSQLVRYIEQENLAWRFILVADPKHKNFARLNAMGIDEHFPKEVVSPSESVADSSAALHVSTERSNAATRSKNSFGFFAAAALMLILVALIVGVNTSRTPSAVPVVYVGDDRVETDLVEPFAEPSQESELSDYLRGLEQKNSEFEERLRSLKALDKPLSITTEAPTALANASGVTNLDSPRVRSRPNDRVVVPVQVQSKKTKKRRPLNRALDQDLVAAITNGDLDTTQGFMADPANFLGRGGNGESSLILGVVSQQSGIVEFLLDNNVDSELVDNNGRTALYYAAISGNLLLVEKLLAVGANVNALTNLDKTPLMAAIHNGHMQVAKALIANGADVNVQDHSGWSSLFYAAWNGESELAALLKEAGARDDLRDRDGYSLTQISKMRAGS